MRKDLKKKNRSVHVNVVTNLVLGTLVLSVGALCIAPDDLTTAANNDAQIYRNGSEYSQGVSLMFNVYWGTEEVYRILDTLKDNQVKATFFIGGCWADDNVECLRAIFADGHEIGNHGYFHKDHSKLTQAKNAEEISSCNRFIELAIGEAPILFAPPSGAYGENMLAACKAMGMKTILWSRDTIDWRDKDANLIYSRATKNIKGGEFVLMHPMAATADVLDDILKYYQTQGLSAITVSENLRVKDKG